jgi:triacylglycerol lipase
MILAGVDVLRYEGEQYASRLEENGVSVKVEMFRKMPHPFIVMDGRLDECKQATNSLCQTLSKAFAAEPGSTIRLS